MNDKKCLILSIISLFLLGLLVSSGTYAYYSFTGSVNKNVTFNTSKTLENYVIYNEGESKFVGDFKVSNNYMEGMHSTISLYKTIEASSVSLKATINMDINSIGSNISNSTALKWTLTEGTNTNIGSILAEGNFNGVNNGDTLTLVPNIEVTTTETFYTIWIWLEVNDNLSELLIGEILDTTVWTEINQSEGMDDRFEVSRINANYQKISATIVSNKYKVISYAITETSDEPTSWIDILSTEQSNVYNLNYTVSKIGTYYVWFKNENNDIVNDNIQITDVDTTIPNVSISSTNNVSNKQTITLSCSDSSGIVSYYFETSSPTNNSTYTAISKTTNMSITREITSAGVYYLSCKDEAGNVSNLTSKTFYETNFIMNNNGIISPNKVITLSGNSFILPTPSASSGYTNNGKWYSNNGLTSVVGTYGSNYTPVGNTTLYSTATDVTAPTGNVTANANMNIIDATVNVTDLGSGVKNTYGWRISTSNVCDSSIDTGSAFTTTTTNTYNYVTTYEGVNYLCVRVEDNAGNKNYLLASAIYITANLLSYDNSKTGVNCSTAQCMIDKIAEILN